MDNSPATRLSLLVRIRNQQDEEAWGEFVDLYAPLIHALACRHGLQDADAADLTQDVLRNVLRAAPQFAYDPAKGSFRGWLFTVARNEIRKAESARRRHAQASGDDDVQRQLEEQPAPDEEVAYWEREYQERLLAYAIEKVRPGFRPLTWQAFWQTAVDNRPIADVAAALGMSAGAVYIARSRVLARIRQEIRRLQEG